MNDIIIRHAVAEDMEEIAQIYDREVLTGTASFEIDPPGRDGMLTRFESITAAGYPYLVAEAGNRIAGYCYAGPYRPRPAYRFTVENSVYVRDDCRGAGLAGMLLVRLVDECRQRGYRQMIAVIGDSAHQVSIRLHRRAGFELIGTLKDVGFKHDRWLDSVIMQRALDSR